MYSFWSTSFESHFYRDSTKDLACCCVHTQTLTCGPLGEVETVRVVNFGTSRSLTGDHLSPVSAAEALVLSLFGHHRLALLLAVASSPHLPTFVFRRRGVVLKDRRRSLMGLWWFFKSKFFFCFSTG